MVRVERTWIGNYFNDNIVHFPDDTEWQIGPKISEKCDYLAAEDYPDELKDDISESQAVCHCRQTAGPEVGREAIMKIRMQVPTEFPANDNSEIPPLGGKPVPWTNSQYIYWGLAYRSFTGDVKF